jgi:cytochrome c oxidase subunit 4
MANHHKEPNYMFIFYALAVLTAIEIGVFKLPIAKILIAILLVGLALSKAALVAMYFMHLRFEKRTLALIAITPLLLCVLLVFALLPDHISTPHKSAPATVSQQSESETHH